MNVTQVKWNCSIGTHSPLPTATDTPISDTQAPAIETDFPKDEFLLACMCTLSSLKIKISYMLFFLLMTKILGQTWPADWVDCF